MSFAHFDEIYEIILDLMEVEEVVNVVPPKEWIEPVKHPVKHPVINEHYWWEEAFNETIIEKEKEEVYV
ncbi:hypothetical protein [Bacillus benzoevorans]|nr:hypothetical protein [Bacillus benzoevorans]